MGAIQDDIEASNAATDPGENYGQPQQVDDPDKVSPPTSDASANTTAVDDGAGNYQAAATEQPQQEEAAIPEEAHRGRSGMTPPHELLRQGASSLKQMIVSYLHGADAVPPQVVDKLKESVDPQGQLPEDDRNLMAVWKARQLGGTEAAWQVLQAQRRMYDAKASFASAALNGVAGKPSDINAAAAAANQAYTHIPDGSQVQFQPAPAGVTATVTARGAHPLTVNLTPEQFNQWLDVGKDGQFDNVYEQGGAAQILQKVAQGPGKPLRQPGAQPMPPQGQPQTGQPQPQMGARPQRPMPPRQARVMDPADPRADQHDKDYMFDAQGHYTGPADPNEEVGRSSPELEAQADRIFGKGNVNAQPERQKWLNEQEAAEEERQNKVDIARGGQQAKIEVARQTGVSRVDAAKAGADARVQSADINANARVTAAGLRSQAMNQQVQARLADIAARRDNARLAQAASTARTMVMQSIANPQLLTPERMDFINKVINAGGQTIDQPTAAPQAGGASTNSQPSVPPAAQRVTGKTYNTPKGPMIWKGTGWAPAGK